MPKNATPPTLAERLTEQFYAWERRGRGWQVWDYPVELEPAFQPFLGHYVSVGPVSDDARKPTWLGSLVEKFRGHLSVSAPDGESRNYFPDIDYSVFEPVPYSGPSQLIELQVSVPPEFKIAKDRAEQLLLSLTYCDYPLAFELIGAKDSLTLQFVASKDDQLQLRQELGSLFPEAGLSQRTDLLPGLWKENGEKETAVVDFGLSNEFMRPLRPSSRLEPDPLLSLVAAFSHLAAGELGVLQVLFQRCRYPWADSVLRSVTDWQGEPFFSAAPEMVAQAAEKVSHPLFACLIRVAGQSPQPGRAWEICRYASAALAQFSRPLSNELIPLTNDGYPDKDHGRDLLSRQSRRSGLLLNSEELVSLVHPSLAPLLVPQARAGQRKTKAAPGISRNQRLILGTNTHRQESVQVGLGPEQRIRHTYVIGASGTGKSTLLLNLIIQDLKNGEGLGVLDPHGDLIDQILGHVPEERFDDVVLLDPSDETYPVGLNILSAHSELEKTLLGSDLVALFRRLSTHWGEQMDAVLANAIAAFLESEAGGTLLDLRRFLVEDDFRNAFLGTVRDPEIVYYWQREFPLLKGKPQASILTRLDAFLRPKLIRYIVAQQDNRLDFSRIMNEKKIFLAKLAQGAIGETNSHLLGALLVAKFSQLAMGRQETAAEERSPFYLYIDEFQDFVTPSMATMLSGARKYRLGLILSHQELRQLWSKDPEVGSAVITNPTCRIAFRLGDFDARKLAPGFSFFDAADLQNLGVGEAVCRVERQDYDFNLKTLPVPKVSPETARTRAKRLMALSRERYGKPREEVRLELSQAFAEPALPREAEKRTDRPRPVQRAKAAPEPVPQASEEPRPVLAAKAVPALGRGGQQHKYLQELVKRLAEARGYRAIIEKPILGGAGSIDVALEIDRTKIACEISVTSTDQQELGNIGKCLAAGFDRVILLAADTKVLRRLKETVAQDLDPANREAVFVFLPDEFVSYLEQEEAGRAAREETVAGYKVKVQYQPLAPDEKDSRKQAISQVILGAMKRLKDGGR